MKRGNNFKKCQLDTTCILNIKNATVGQNEKNWFILNLFLNELEKKILTTLLGILNAWN